MPFGRFTMPDWLRTSLPYGILTLAILAATPVWAATGPDQGRKDGLLHLVRQDCGSCHGMTMKGGLGPALLPATLKNKPDDTLVDIILDGVPETPMPPWRPLLAPEDAAWIVKQLKKGL